MELDIHGVLIDKLLQINLFLKILKYLILLNLNKITIYYYII